MHNAHIHYPHTTAIAAGTGVRVGGSLKFDWRPGMAMRSSQHPVDRGISR